MDKWDYIEQGEEHLLHTYNRYQIVLDKGEGVYLYDTDGKKYLDFAAGIAVVSLGYSNEEYKTALKNQVDRLMHTSNYFYHPPMAAAARRFLQVSAMDRVFFTNSGTEAVEGAIKTALKYAYSRDGHTDHEIIAMENSFHGRSLGALSVTGNKKYREPFEPLPGKVRFAEFNHLESVKALINEKTCAVILETIQGEGGIYPASEEFLTGIRALCKKAEEQRTGQILLILDEIQCGMGRTGRMFAWEHYGVKPDVLICAKAMGNGFPVGAFAMTEKVAEASLVPGDHGTTYGGNPLGAAAVNQVLEIFERDQMEVHAKQLGLYLTEVLDKMKAQYDFISARRGFGLMQGLELTLPVSEIVTKAMEKGLIIITAGNHVLRFLPPLIIEREHIDEMAVILRDIFDQYL